jgi:hypothetical protein
VSAPLMCAFGFTDRLLTQRTRIPAEGLSGREGSRRAGPLQDRGDGADENLQVQPHRPMVDIFHV